jgi:uncharacterized membrane protein YbhN (UPF0104 family)
LAVLELIHGVARALAHARIGLVALATALHLGGLIVTGERCRVVVAALGSRLTLARSTLINLAGIFVRNATPTTGLGGDASRIALLRSDGVALPQATAALAYMRAAELPALAAVVGLSLPQIATMADRSARTLATAAGLTAIIAMVGYLNRRRLRSRLTTLWEHTAHVRIAGRPMAVAIALAALAQAETILRQIVVAAAFGLPLTLRQSATVTALSIAGGLMPTVGSLGAIEGGLITGLMVCGAPAETAVAITLVERAISYLLSTVLGAAALAMLGGRAIVRIISHRDANVVAAG